MFVSADQLVAHAIGDYVLQSDWMATNKKHSLLAALLHVGFYGLAFLLYFNFSITLWQYAFIVGTHFVIDFFGLARYVVWLKNLLAPPDTRLVPWSQCRNTGYPDFRPNWLSVWLLIIVDNIMHVICNAVALKYL